MMWDNIKSVDQAELPYTFSSVTCKHSESYTKTESDPAIFPPEIDLRNLAEPIHKNKDIYHSFVYNSKNCQPM